MYMKTAKEKTKKVRPPENWKSDLVLSHVNKTEVDHNFFSGEVLVIRQVL